VRGGCRPDRGGPNIIVSTRGSGLEYLCRYGPSAPGIERRNEIRREAQLPLLSIPKELRRMKTQEVSKEFERFAAAHNKAVWEDILKRRRDVEGNPNWRPNSLEGMCYQSQVRKIVWEQFYLARPSLPLEGWYYTARRA